MTNIYIETDVFQTWQFDFIYKRSFVEREHVNDDTIGLHTIPEGIETGEYIQDDYDQLDDFHLVWIVRAEKNLNGSNIYGHNYGGIYYSGCAYMCFSYGDVVSLITEYETDPSHVGIGVQNIINIYMIPYEFTNMDDYHHFDPFPTSRNIRFRESSIS